MLKVAMLSYWHVHAWDYTRQVQARTDCKIVAVWDELPERGKQSAAKLEVPFYENLQELLNNPDIDAVVVDAPSNIHAEVMVAAAQAGKHIFTEKVLAITTEEADRIIDAVQQAGVKFMISLPRLMDRNTIFAKNVIEEGLLGQITLVRTRVGHDGALPNQHSADGWLPAHFYNKEQCGGGALYDFGCHPMYLSHHFLGMPSKVTAQYGYVTGREVEDNSVTVLNYDNGAMAIVEASFVSRFSPFSIEIYGSHGCLLIGNTIQLKTNKIDQGAASGWITPDRLPQNGQAPIDQWVDHILYDKEPIITIELGRVLTQLMEAANLSAIEGKTVTL